MPDSSHIIIHNRSHRIVLLRKVIWLSGSHAITLPPHMLKQLRLKVGDYIEIGMSDADTITVNKHLINQERPPHGH